MTQLKAPAAALTALVNGVAAGTLVSTGQLVGGGGNAGGLRLVTYKGFQDAQPAELVASNAAITALINTGARTLTPPAAWPQLWLEVPSSWLPQVLGIPASQCPQSGPLELSVPDLIVDAQGGWAALLTSLGWTAASPTTNGAVPVLNS